MDRGPSFGCAWALEKARSVYIWLRTRQADYEALMSISALAKAAINSSDDPALEMDGMISEQMQLIQALSELNLPNVLPNDMPRAQ